MKKGEIIFFVSTFFVVVIFIILVFVIVGKTFETYQTVAEGLCSEKNGEWTNDCKISSKMIKGYCCKLFDGTEINIDEELEQIRWLS